MHDPRTLALEKAKKRLKRLNYSNIQFHDSRRALKRMKGKFDVVIVDAPCTGFLKRNWSF